MRGIYLIRSKINNKVYIGQSFNIRKRINTHLELLRNDKHFNAYLQKDFNQYGEDNFSFEILYTMTDDLIDRQKLYDLEIFYISLYDSTNRVKGYNIESGGKSFGRVSEETKNKIGLSNTGKKHSEETKKKLSDIRKGKPSHWKGKKQTKEHSQKRIQLQFGKVWVTNGECSKFVTVEQSEVLKQKGFHLGRKTFKWNSGKYAYNGKKYTLTEISRLCGVPRSSLFFRLKNGWSMEKATSTPVKKYKT